MKNLRDDTGDNGAWSRGKHNLNFEDHQVFLLFVTRSKYTTVQVQWHTIYTTLHTEGARLLWLICFYCMTVWDRWDHQTTTVCKLSKQATDKILYKVCRPCSLYWEMLSTSSEVNQLVFEGIRWLALMYVSEKLHRFSLWNGFTLKMEHGEFLLHYSF